MAARETERDLRYRDGEPDPDGKDMLDLYLPEDRQRAPVVVFLHGGALRAGDKRESEHVALALVARGMAAVLPNYRLWPRVLYPAHVRDVAAAITWIHRHIAGYGLSRERLFVMGHSAGAYLAALLALDSRYLSAEGLTPAILRGLVCISGHYHVERVRDDLRACGWADDPEIWAEASPPRHARADAPPLLFLFGAGEERSRYEHAHSIVSALYRAGHRDSAAQEIPGREHMSIWQEFGTSGDPVIETVTDFIRSRLP